MAVSTKTIRDKDILFDTSNKNNLNSMYMCQEVIK